MKSALLETKSTIRAQGIGRRSLDGKLSNAEMNIVRISVSQDGTGDYLTIKEALNSIPLFNTRRVILAINPGLYR